MEKIPVSQPLMLGNEKKYVEQCMETNWISSKGQFIDKFEKEFNNYLGIDHSISCTNGTVALHLALLALGVKQGDEVIVPSFTYIATANAVKYCNATPIFADVELGTWNLDPEDFRRKITKRTKAVIVVHIYGLPANLIEIMNIAKENNIKVIEDAAEAIGSSINGKKIGTWGDIATFSFYGNKIITTGEGGMVVTNNQELADKMFHYKTQGMSKNKRYWFDVIGYNYRMTNIAAAIGSAQMENIDQHLNLRIKVADQYKKLLNSVEGIEIQAIPQGYHHSYWMFCILLDEEKTKVGRDELMTKLSKNNIETRPFFYPLHTMPPYQNGNLEFPISENIAKRGINLPTFGELPLEDIERIVKLISDFI